MDSNDNDPLLPMSKERKDTKDDGFSGRTVRIAINVDYIYNLDTQNQTFTVAFTAIYEWHDKTLAMYDVSKVEDEVDWTKHFVPDVQFKGAVEVSLPDQLVPRIHNAKECIAKLTARFMGTFTSELNLRYFPFDAHTLVLQFTPRKWGSKLVSDAERTVRLVSFSNDMKGSANRKHKLNVSGTTSVPDFDILLPKDAGLEGVGKSGSEYHLRLIAVRRSQSVLINVGLFILLIQSLSFTAFWLHPKDELSDRLGVVLTLLLTVVAFKLMVKEDLPAVPYSTDMDKYIIAATFMLFVQAFLHTLPVQYSQYDWMDNACFRIIMTWFVLQHIWTFHVLWVGWAHRRNIIHNQHRTTVARATGDRRSLSPMGWNTQ